MTQLWLALVGLVQTAITLIAAASGGSIGLAIVTVSVALRLAMLPFTIRLARRAEQQRRLLEQLKPELERLKKRLRNQPDRLSSETVALYRKHGVQPLDGTSALSLLVQLPLLSALYTAISRGLGAGQRFLWIADLAKPDILLVAITGLLTYLTSMFGSGPDAKAAIGLLGTVLTVVIMWRVSAAIGLYWASSTAIGAAQAFWLRQRSREAGV